MDNKLYDQILVIQSLVYTKNQFSDETKQDNNELKKKLKNYDFEFFDIKALLNKVLGNNKTPFSKLDGFTKFQWSYHCVTG